MKPELMWLLWAVALTVVQMLIAVSGATLQVGLPKLAATARAAAAAPAGPGARSARTTTCSRTWCCSPLWS